MVRDLLSAAVIMRWYSLGLRLACSKAQRGNTVGWVGAATQIDEAAVTLGLKGDCMHEVRELTQEFPAPSVVAVT